MKKPLFDVHLKVWENWKHYWSTVPWFLKKMSQGEYDDIGRPGGRVVAGSYNPTANEVHLYLDEMAQAVIGKLDKEGMFNNKNYEIELVKEIFSVLIHELVHSLDIFESEKNNEEHQISIKKLDELQKKSLWYFELIKLCHSLERKLFNIKDSSKEFDSSQDSQA
jgi:hypothetical protein